MIALAVNQILLGISGLGLQIITHDGSKGCLGCPLDRYMMKKKF